MRIIGYAVAALALFVSLRWYGSQPAVRVVRRSTDSTFPAVPTTSVRLLSSYGGDGCVPAREVARLFVDGRLFSPSNAAVHRALLREAGRIGANAVAFTTPSMDDRPVLGVIDRLWDDGDGDDAMQHTAKTAGHAVALRCLGQVSGPASR